jgi:uncharacterized protein
VNAPIDAHGHLGRYAQFHVPNPDAGDLVRRLDQMGVERLVLASHASFTSDEHWGNELAAKACADYPGRLYAYAGVNPNYPEDIRPALEKCFSQDGFVGIKLHAATHDCKLEAPGYASAWEWAAQHGCPVLIHYWNGCGRCGPDNVREVAGRYPGVRILLAHLGGVGNDYKTIPVLAAEHDNLWFDTCGSRHCRGMLEELVAAGLGDRLLYGSDMPFIDPGSQLGKVQHADIPEDVRQDILRGNAARLFGWEN